eukprot:TRINITY_DN4724_c0_g1_i2.p1 TRINITY_DN4724_c0_g1~~TRINITY_DN4724_c0_g1_i2.p1  ORF type:complete len:135 (+),score=7.16 TRINITY_DN4724_c0_g1_i2:308-712(+)
MEDIFFLNNIYSNFCGKMSCQHVGSSGKSAGVACRNKTNHGNFCAKHKKKVRAALADDEVFGQPKQVQAPVAPKHKFSAFRFTLNSQEDISGMTVDRKQDVRQLMGMIFKEKHVVKYLRDRTNADSAKNIIKLE